MEFNLIVVRSAQPKALAQFYTHFGLNFDYHQHGNGPLHYSTKVGVIVLEIYPLLKNQTEVDQGLRLGFKVKNLDHLLTQLIDVVDIVQEAKQTQWGYRAVIKDIEGRKIELVE